jgi:hypothetical protein
MTDKTPTNFDFWYAVNNTEIVKLPEGRLETFGATVLNYHLVTELMDAVDRVRIREGRIRAGQPTIVTPDAYSEVLLEGFGDEASKYIEWIKSHEKDIRILQYGYSLRRESFSEHVVSDTLKTVVERVNAEVRARNDPMSCVVVGVDSPWDVCLIKLFREVIRKSAQANIRDMERRKLFEDDAGVPRGIRDEIEQDFLAASRDPSLIEELARKLQRRHLFDDYQDRFFALVKAARKP